MDFETIFEEYFDRVYYKILGLVKNSSDAEDIAQEVFISVYKNLDKFRKDSNIYTWIYRIAINKTYDFFKKRKNDLEINEEILLVADTFSADTNILLEERLKTLAPREKEIVILKDIYGYKLKEIANMKSMNISTIKSVYYKAIRDMGGEWYVA